MNSSTWHLIREKPSLRQKELYDYFPFRESESRDKPTQNAQAHIYQYSYIKRISSGKDKRIGSETYQHYEKMPNYGI
jgi:hypothetical protein